MKPKTAKTELGPGPGKEKHRMNRMSREQALEFARLLHASNAWHCGCATCVEEREYRRKVIRGPWPIVVETWRPTEEEKRVLLGEEE